MAFNIGEVLSPSVAAALMRRGENRGRGFVQRHPQRRTLTRSGGGGQEGLAREREQRLSEAQAARLELQRESFDASRTDADRSFGLREQGQEQAGRRLEANEGQNLLRTRKEGSALMGRIGRALKDARKIDPDTGKPIAGAQEEAQRQIAGYVQQLRNLGLPDGEVQSILDQIRGTLPSTPAARAPGPSQLDRQASGATPGIDAALQAKLENLDAANLEPERQAGILAEWVKEGILSGEQAKAWLSRKSPQASTGGAPKRESGLVREISRPTRTP